MTISPALLVVFALAVAMFAIAFGVRERRRSAARQRQTRDYIDQIGEMLDCSRSFALAARTSSSEVCTALDKALRARFPEIDCLVLFEQIGSVLVCSYATAGSRCERYVGRAEYDITGASAKSVLPLAALHTRKIVTTKDGPTGIHPGDVFSLAIPLELDQGRTSIVVLSSSERSFDEACPAIDMFVEQAEPALLLAGEREEIEARATYDSLTGLLRRGPFESLLRDELQFCEQSGSSLALLNIDADGFKSWNDTFGHHCGDLLLQRIAQLLKSNSRGQRAIVARNGGDEFCVVLRETDKIAAVSMAKSIGAAIAFDDRSALLPAEMVDPPALSVTASIGVAVYPRDAGDAKALELRADELMYAAKNSGKDRVCYIGDDGEVQQVRPSENDRRDTENRPTLDRRSVSRPFAVPTTEVS